MANAERNGEVQNISNSHLEDLPNEVLLKVFSFLDITDLICCGQVSKRIRAISLHGPFWKKANLYNKRVSAKLLKQIVTNQCKYLSLHSAYLYGNLFLEKVSKLSYLELTCCQTNNLVGYHQGTHYRFEFPTLILRSDN